MNKNDQKILKSFEEKIGYSFKDRAVLKEALSHSSYANENKVYGAKCNERLEFLGDSVLGLSVSSYLFKNLELQEGELTKKRATIVCEKSLSQAAKKINMGDFLFLGKGEEATGGRDRSSILADAFEAVIGAIYIDGGMEQATEFIQVRLNEIIRASMDGNIFRDHKTELQEILQSIGKGEKIRYVLIDEFGPDHDKKFIMEVRFNEKVLGSGQGRTKKEAEQEAAKKAIERFA